MQKLFVLLSRNNLAKKQLDMKRTITFISALLFLANYLFAGPIDPERAFEIANSFWNGNARINKDIKLEMVRADKPSKASSHGIIKAEDPRYYIFSGNEDRGFVIVSGDDKLTPVIGYSENGDAGEMPEALSLWLQEYSNYVDEVRAGTAEPIIVPTKATGTNIAPMLKTSWDQGSPYNNYCPEVNNQKTPTGCTATAMAQIMKFHEWPQKGTKKITWYNNVTGYPETIDLTKSTYDWSNMLPHYRNGYTQVQADAVAKLMIDVGKAIESNYALSGTGSSDVKASYALVNYFDYSPDLFIARRHEYSHDEFITIIRNNLNAKQPILWCGYGQSYSSGHAFVCDGIDENDMLHIDWGWNGAYNGYFNIGVMAPGGSGIGGGEDRYNVGQVIIANIKPRKSGESNKNGEPTLYDYEVINPTTNTVVEEYTAKFSSGTATLKILASFLNWSHSNIEMYFGYNISSTDGTYSKNFMSTDPSDKEILKYDESIGYYMGININNTNTSSSNYLKKGTYTVKIYYQDINGKPKAMKGENNSLTLVVGSSSATLSKTKPQLALTGFQTINAPEYQNDGMALSATFTNNNSNNATVAIVPIANLMNGSKVVKSDTITSSAILVNTLDKDNLATTFNISKSFADSGTYCISFAYDFRNHYTDHNLSAIDKKMLKSISGTSPTFEVKPLTDGPRPQVTNVSMSSNVIGTNLNMTATISNISATESTYSATVGILVEKDGKTIVLTSSDVNIAQNASAQVRFNNTDYVPALEAGSYYLTICELKGEEWSPIAPGNRYQMELVAPEKPILYANGKITIGYNNLTRPGDDTDVKLALGCSYADFDGYLRVNVTSGITAILRSEYIPVTIKNGEIIDINLKSACGAKAPVGEWDIIIKYYDKNKREQGSVSKNTIYYPNNGHFVVDDVTSVDSVGENTISVRANGNHITVEGTAENTINVVYSIDGKEIYRGTNKDIEADRGIYIIAVQTPGEKPYTTKVFVK